MRTLPHMTARHQALRLRLVGVKLTCPRPWLLSSLPLTTRPVGKATPRLSIRHWSKKVKRTNLQGLWLGKLSQLAGDDQADSVPEKGHDWGQVPSDIRKEQKE